MDSTGRSPGMAAVLVFVVILSGCAGIPGPAGTNGTATTDAGTPTTDGKPPTSITSADDNNGGPDRLVIKEHATWVTKQSRTDQKTHREYITLRYHPQLGNMSHQPFNFSGYTVTYGDGPTYTIPENVRLGPRSGGSVYIWTDDGDNRAYGEWVASVRSQYVLHANHDGPLIAQDGTTITIRNRSGGIVAQKTVTPLNGTVPFVPTVNASEFINGSVDTIEEAKNATSFALRAPTNVPEGYQLVGFSTAYATGPIYGYVLFYSREPNDRSDDISVHVVAPRAVNESDRPSGSHSVNVGTQTGHYATQETGNDTNGVLQFIGPDGWGYYVRGPQGEQRLIQIGKSIEGVEGNTTE